MKKFLLPEAGQFYKANLHQHTTFSDGRFSPAEIKRVYQKHGYSIVAFTDHDIFTPHDELRDESFLPMHGYEMEFNEDVPPRRTCHLCLVALDESITKPVCWNNAYLCGLAKEKPETLDLPDEPPFVRSWTPECINTVIREGREHGFFVTYNHPVWSLENYPAYSRYEGMNAMEMMNYGCVIEGFPDYNPQVYDDLLRQGKRLFAIYADDSHCHRAEDDPQFDACGGWIMIKAEKLDYKSVGKALEKGNFYSSAGPELYSLVFEDGKISLTCSPCEKIMLWTGRRRAELRVDPEGKLTEVSGDKAFSVKPEDGYVRLTLWDKNGRTADTNAYFVDELL